MAGKGFPLDNAFDDLRRVVEDVRQALLDFKRDLTGAGPGPGGGSSGGGGGNAGAADAQAARESFARQAREVVKTLGELQRAAKGAGGIAKTLGLPEASRELTTFAGKLETVKVAAEGLGAGMKVLAVAGGPVVTSLFVVVGALFAVEKVFEKVTDKAFTLTETLQVMGLSLVKSLGGFAGLKSEAVKAVTMGLVDLPIDAEQSRIEIDALQAQIQELYDHAAPAGSRDNFDLILGFLKDMGVEVRNLWNLVPSAEESPIANLISPEAINKAKAGLADLTVELARLGVGDLGAAMRTQLAAQLAPIEAQAAAIKARIAEATASGSTIEAGAKPRLAQLEDEIRLRKQIVAVQLEQAEAERQALTPLGQFRTAMADMANVTKTTYEFMTSAVSQFASTAAGAIVDSFGGARVSVNDIFAGLLRDLAKQLLASAITGLIGSLFGAIGGSFAAQGGGAGLLSTFTSALSGGTAGGKAAGGSVPLSNGSPSFLHLFARGLAGGGRPAGLPASDTVPAWLTPGEYVQPLAAVREYGVEVMEAIRRRVISAPALRALAAGVSIPPAMSAPRVSFATGGSVPASGGGAMGGPTAAYVVANEQSLSRMLSGGHGALIRWLRDNKGAVNSAIG